MLPAPFLCAASIVRGNCEGNDTVNFGATARDEGAKLPRRKEDEELEERERPRKEPMRLRAVLVAIEFSPAAEKREDVNGGRIIGGASGSYGGGVTTESTIGEAEWK